MAREVWEMSLDVLLLSDAGDFASALPPLGSFAREIRQLPLTDDLDGQADGIDVALVDARTDPAAARTLSRRLTARAPALAVVAVVASADGVGDDEGRHFDDVALAGTGADELRVRLRMAVDRRRAAVDGALKFGELLLHPTSFTATLAGADLALTPTEFNLLNFLVQQAGQAFSRTRLMHEVWGYDCGGRVRTVDVHVRRVRAKLGLSHQSMISTVPGVGYAVRTPPEPEWIGAEPAAHPESAAL